MACRLGLRVKGVRFRFGLGFKAYSLGLIKGVRFGVRTQGLRLGFRVCEKT